VCCPIIKRKWHVIYTILEPEDYNNQKFSSFNYGRAAALIATIIQHFFATTIGLELYNLQ
jgi:hypothetical protein